MSDARTADEIRAAAAALAESAHQLVEVGVAALLFACLFVGVAIGMFLR